MMYNDVAPDATGSATIEACRPATGAGVPSCWTDVPLGPAAVNGGVTTTVAAARTSNVTKMRKYACLHS